MNVVERHLEDIKYYNDYKHKLVQFIIVHACYEHSYSSSQNIRKVPKRIHITHGEMLGLLKEIQRLEILTYKLKNHVTIK